MQVALFILFAFTFILAIWWNVSDTTGAWSRKSNLEASVAQRYGVVVVDMWDWHWCKTSTQRARSMIERMNAALRRYAPNLGCLPARTVVLWVTPYASNKVPWQQRLVDAARNETLKAFAAGVFSEHVLLLDAWALTASPGAPKTTDGNHRVATFQTTLWGLIRSALRVLL